ncbi:Toll/interleukin-1 receptor homology (TIR) domain [Arabidopsis thaliana x Arabidopsis arenosa]|uniref:Toll/interleukin-1 receptor homology (TIR) domain n=1 Tax=Arabidopsis thaliana x Arabidopsis arenosa TaxID=1240361 RepID=A0A8T2BP88_9BRAS|nr:Toll/interleukin-1 receptor homology (TIR) domain [Arabidopsis thaliana x Arabidopsis arenosa]
MSCATATKYDVFLSFRGLDTRSTFISFLYKELVRMNIRTFKDDEELENGQRISPELKRAIEESRFAVVVFSKNYAASPWCLNELVKIMDFENKDSITVMPIFYGVEPGHVRWQTGVVAEQFKKHESREDHEKVFSWRQALAAFAQLSGDCSGDDDSKLVDKIAHEISKKMTIFATISNGRNLVGIDRHMKALNRKLDLNSNKDVRMVGIWTRGGDGRSALAKYVYQDMCQQFESHCFLGNVKTISQGRHSAHLHHEFLQNIQRENPNKQSLKNQKVLLVADDVDKVKQLEALAGDFSCFGPGSVVIITTQDKHLLGSYGIKDVYEVDILTFQKVCRLLAFKKRDISAAFRWALCRATNFATECFCCQSSTFAYWKVTDSV